MMVSVLIVRVLLFSLLLGAFGLGIETDRFHLFSGADTRCLHHLNMFTRVWLLERRMNTLMYTVMSTHHVHMPLYETHHLIYMPTFVFL